MSWHAVIFAGSFGHRACATSAIDARMNNMRLTAMAKLGLGQILSQRAPRIQADASCGAPWFNCSVLDLIAFAEAIDSYLDVVKRRRPTGPTTPDCDGEKDRRWSSQFGGRESHMAALIAVSTMEAATQHLRGLAALLRDSEVDLALEALARACLEASGRTLRILDVAADPATRVARALNVAWQIGRSRAVIEAEAARLQLKLKVDKRGRTIGIETSENRVDLLAAALGPILSDAAVRQVWSLWSNSAHGDLLAAMRALGGNSSVGLPLIGAAAEVAAFAHVAALRRLDQYLGHIGELGAPERLRAVARIALLIYEGLELPNSQ